MTTYVFAMRPSRESRVSGMSGSLGLDGRLAGYHTYGFDWAWMGKMTRF